MAQMSDYLESKLIDHCFRNIPFATPGLVYIALYSIDPTDTDTGTELSGSGYARVQVTMGDQATPGTSLNSAEMLFPTATADWTAVSHIGVRDEATGGNLLMHQALTAPVSVLNHNNFRIPIGDLELTFA